MVVPKSMLTTSLASFVLVFGEDVGESVMGGEAAAERGGGD
jgi:hypothetical protein